MGEKGATFLGTQVAPDDNNNNNNKNNKDKTPHHLPLSNLLSDNHLQHAEKEMVFIPNRSLYFIPCSLHPLTPLLLPTVIRLLSDRYPFYDRITAP